MNHSPWLEFDRKSWPSLSGDQTCDIAILGAGIAGVATLYYLLKNTDKKIILVEGSHVASGASGHNAGFAINTMEALTQNLIKQFGIEKTNQGFKELDAGWNLLQDILKETKLEYSFIPLNTGALGYASANLFLKAVEEELSDDQIDRGGWEYFFAEEAASSIVISDELKKHITFIPHQEVMKKLRVVDSGYIGASIPYNDTIRRGRMNSAFFCYKVLEYLEAHYSHRFQVYENSWINTVAINSTSANLKTNNASVRSDVVILCTNGYTTFDIVDTDTNKKITKLKDSIWGLVGYSAAYEDTSGDVFTCALFDERKLYKDVGYFYYHMGPSLKNKGKTLTVIGGCEERLKQYERYDPEKPITPSMIEEYKRFIVNTFGVKQEKFEYLWSGLMGYTSQEVRWIGQDPLYKTLYYNLGCNGIGLLTSIVGGEKIARLINGEVTPPSLFDLS